MITPMRLGQSDGISIYPNPANDVVTIAPPQVASLGTTDSSPELDFEVKITDLFGREMIVGKTSGSNLLTLDVSELPAGVYLVEVWENGVQISTTNFIKL